MEPVHEFRNRLSFCNVAYMELIKAFAAPPQKAFYQLHICNIPKRLLFRSSGTGPPQPSDHPSPIQSYPPPNPQTPSPHICNIPKRLSVPEFRDGPPLSKIVIHTSAHPYCTEVWMTILESGRNLWMWLVGVVSRRWVWLVGGIYGNGYNV